ncbi:MAG: calcium-binding protein [Gemmobacter sp.]
MLIQYTQGGNFFEAAFYNPLVDDFDVDIVSNNSTQIVVRNPGTGVVTTFTGTGFPQFPFPPLPGTITGIAMVDAGGNPLATITNIAWGLQATLDAVEAAVGDDALTLLNGLLSLQDITLDASAAVEGIEGLDFAGVTSDITVIGSDFADEIFGGQGNDTIDAGLASNTIDEGEQIHASGGNDTIDFSGIVAGNSWTELLYDDLTGPITLNINALTNTGTVAKGPGQGTDTLIDVARAMDDRLTFGFDVYGTAAGDSFTVRTAEFADIFIQGRSGADSYNLTLSEGGRIQLSFGGGTQGLVLNAATGVIANDGYGFAEALALTRLGGADASRFQVRGTQFADSIVGSAGRDVFRTDGGNDTVDGGDGFDLVRYDRPQFASAITVDLVAGTVTGTANNGAFTHSLTSIEEVRGSQFNDTIQGSGVDEFLEGQNGDDLLEGRAGSDTLLGGAGNDTLTGGLGRDNLDGGDGDDTIVNDRRFYDDIDGGEGNEATGDTANFSASAGHFTLDLAQGTYTIGGITYDLQGIENLLMGNGRDIITGGDGAEVIQSGGKRDQISAGLGNDTIDAGAGNDVVYAALGNDSTNGGSDVDTLDFSALSSGVSYSMATGASNVIGTHLGYESVIAGSGNDTITGADTNDTVRGGAGNDSILGGRGADDLYGLAGLDTLAGGAGNDTLTGGAFADTFLFVRVVSAGADLITDWNNGADRLALDNELWTGALTAAQVVGTFASVVNGDVVFDFGARGSFTLDGITSTAGLDARIDII